MGGKLAVALVAVLAAAVALAIASATGRGDGADRAEPGSFRTSAERLERAAARIEASLSRLESAAREVRARGTDAGGRSLPAAAVEPDAPVAVPKSAESLTPTLATPLSESERSAAREALRALIDLQEQERILPQVQLLSYAEVRERYGPPDKLSSDRGGVTWFYCDDARRNLVIQFNDGIAVDAYTYTEDR